MHYTFSSFKVTSFGLHPGHHQTYALIGIYEKKPYKFMKGSLVSSFVLNKHRSDDGPDVDRNWSLYNC
jgi:hypothetical protein